MTIAPGWYPFPADPPRTVRRWNGSEWIGFPVPIEPGATRDHSLPAGTSAAASQVATRPAAGVGRSRALAFRNQQPLAIFAVIALCGLGASIAATAAVLFELRDLLAPTTGFDGSTQIDVPALSDPLDTASTRRMLMVWLGGGACFLLWMWRAYRNTGIPVSLGGDHVGSWNPIGWLILAFLSTMMRPVTRTMSQLVALINNEPDRLKASTIVALFWRWLWVVSAYAIVLGWIVQWNEDLPPTRTGANLMTYLLIAHIVSLVLAAVLVLIITRDHDRRRRY